MSSGELRIHGESDDTVVLQGAVEKRLQRFRDDAPHRLVFEGTGVEVEMRNRGGEWHPEPVVLPDDVHTDWTDADAYGEPSQLMMFSTDDWGRVLEVTE